MVKGIMISVTNKTWSPGIKSIRPNITQDEYERFLRYIAFYLRDELVKAIDKQRYKKTWKPLNIQYLRYKERHNLSTNTWEATGLLKKSIKVFKRGEYYVVGFKRTDVYPKTLARINYIARILEYGAPDANIPARPLFRKLHEYMRKNVQEYYSRYEREVLGK